MILNKDTVAFVEAHVTMLAAKLYQNPNLNPALASFRGHSFAAQCGVFFGGNMLTQERVKYLFDYRDDGNLIWANPTSNRVKAGRVAGCVMKIGYLEIQVDTIRTLVHRVIFLWHHGYTPEYVDHIDRDNTNNRIENLRKCTMSQNILNSKTPKNNTSGYKGVTKGRRVDTWKAQLNTAGVNKCLGTFDSKEAAHEAYLAAGREVCIEFFHGGDSDD